MRERKAMRWRTWIVAAALALGLAGPVAADSALEFEFTSIEGEALPMSAYAGRPVLVVNTASMCGFTYQYTSLQRLWETYRDRGLVVLGVPSNDFGGQEPGSNEDIKSFCEVNFDIDFPLTEKVHVRGADSHPLFAWFREKLGAQAGPRWNFHKYLIAPDGSLAGAWPSSVEPNDAQITVALEPLLAPRS
jgi:glutathione peroxidase